MGPSADTPLVVEEAELVDGQRELLRDRRARDLHRLMQTDWGRRIVRNLLDANYFYRTHASNNGVESQRNEGRRMVALDLRAEVDAVCPELLDLMEQDYRKERKDREQANDDGNE